MMKWGTPNFQKHTYIYTYVYIYTYIFIEGSLEVKFPTIWTDGKAEVGRVRKAFTFDSGRENESGRQNELL